MTKKILGVGGGAAGMMAAITAARAGASVTLFERNAKLGRKISITGKGRCNLTNDCTPEEALRHYLFYFKDETFECLAQSYDLRFVRGETQETEGGECQK